MKVEQIQAGHKFRPINKKRRGFKKKKRFKTVVQEIRQMKEAS